MRASFLLCAALISARAAQANCNLPNNANLRVGRATTFTYGWTTSQYAGLSSSIRDYVWNNSGDVTAAFRIPAGVLSSGYTAVNRYPANDHRWGSATVTGRDYTWFDTNHPSWVLRSTDHATPAFYFSDTSYIPIDISNPDVRSFRISAEINVIVSAGLGISVDNVGSKNDQHDSMDNPLPVVGVCSVSIPDYTTQTCEGRGGTWTQLYSGNADGSCPDGTGACFTDDQVTWLNALKFAVNILNQCVSANVGYYVVDVSDPTRANTTRLIEAPDIWFDEEGFNNAHHPPLCLVSAGLTGDQWRAKTLYVSQRNSPTVQENAVCNWLYSTTLSSDITNSQTSISVASNAGFPSSAPFPITIGGEQLTVTAGQAGTTWTVTRGVNGTVAAAHDGTTLVGNALAGLKQNREVLQWAIASHLLSKNAHSYIETFFTDDNFYNDLQTGGTWPEYWWTHGATTFPIPGSSPPYDIASGTYYRIFANGAVFVNPDVDITTVYDLGSAIYHTFDGLRYTGPMVLPPLTARILINGEPPNGSVARN